MVELKSLLRNRVAIKFEIEWTAVHVTVVHMRCSYAMTLIRHSDYRHILTIALKFNHH